MAHFLKPILEPSSVAVIGASRDPRKRGYQALRALKESGYRGGIHPVHPDGGELLGLTVAPSVEALEPPPDLAYVCTRAATIPALVEACGRTPGRPVTILPLVLAACSALWYHSVVHPAIGGFR